MSKRLSFFVILQDNTNRVLTLVRLCRGNMNYANREVRERVTIVYTSCRDRKNVELDARCSPIVLSIIVRGNCVRESFDGSPKFDSYNAAYDFLPSYWRPNGAVSKSSDRNVSEIRSVQKGNRAYRYYSILRESQRNDLVFIRTKCVFDLPMHESVWERKKDWQTEGENAD